MSEWVSQWLGYIFRIWRWLLHLLSLRACFFICNYICTLYLHYHFHNDQITHFCQMSEAVVRKMRAGLCMQQRLCHLPWHLPLHLFSARNFLSTYLRIFCKQNPMNQWTEIKPDWLENDCSTTQGLELQTSSRLFLVARRNLPFCNPSIEFPDKALIFYT